MLQSFSKIDRMSLENNWPQILYFVLCCSPAMTDVTKQKDMSGFYRYLYRQSDRPGELTDVAGKTTTEWVVISSL